MKPNRLLISTSSKMLDWTSNPLIAPPDAKVRFPLYVVPPLEFIVDIGKFLPPDMAAVLKPNLVSGTSGS